MKWLLVLIIVLCNTAGDVLNTFGMRRHGEVREFHPSALRRLLASLARNGYVMGGMVAMAISFFALLSLLSIAELSFAIPTTSAFTAAGRPMPDPIEETGNGSPPIRPRGASLSGSPAAPRPSRQTASSKQTAAPGTKPAGVQPAPVPG